MQVDYELIHNKNSEATRAVKSAYLHSISTHQILSGSHLSYYTTL